MKPSVRLYHYLALILLGCLIYSNSFSGEFVCDDFGSILAHKDALAGFHLGKLWSAYDTRIVGGLSFAFNYALGGVNVPGYHIVNLLIHILNAILVYHLVLQMLTSPVMRQSRLTPLRDETAFFSSLIFLAHPLQTQAVSYIVQRYISLATLFFLAALICYGRARRDGKIRDYAAAGLLALVSMATKEAVCILPLVIVIYDLVFWGGGKGDKRRRLVILSGGVILAVTVLLLARAREEQKLFVLLDAPAVPNAWHYFLTELNVLRTYLRMLVWPYPQSHSYDYALRWSLFDAGTVFSIGLLAALSVFAVWLLRRGNRVLGFGIVWYFVTILPQVVFVVMYGKYGAGFMYDHWQYLPLAGFSFFLAGGAGYLLKDERPRRMVLIAVVTVFCVLTFQRNRVWRTEVSLWEDVVRHNPKTLLNHFALGRAYQNKGRTAEAAACYVRAVRLKEGTPVKKLLPPQRVYLARSYSNLGIIKSESGKDSEALELFRKSLAVNPVNAPAYINLGIASYRVGRLDDAANAFLRYLDYDRNNPYPYYYLGLISRGWHKNSASREYLNKAARLFEKQGDAAMAARSRRALTAE